MLYTKRTSNIIHSLIITLLFSIILISCSKSDNNNKKNLLGSQKVEKYTKDTLLKGKVSNKKGIKISGEIKVTDSKGKTVLTSQLQKSNYQITLPAGTELPITLTFFPDSNGSDKNKLIAVVIYTSIKKYDINELTTLIAKKAKALGGYTHSNMVLAADSTVGVPDANKTSTGFRGDPTKQYGGWH
ncbi:MAG: hypothetical protein KAT04_08530 [Methylococcales bacterium]|nr:hypothetical protein [Methylococcales bacterium]